MWGAAALTNVLVTSLIEHFVTAVMQDDALKALISDLGEGIVIDQELLEGCSIAAHDLDDMDAVQAAEVAAEQPSKRERADDKQNKDKQYDTN